MRWQPDEEMILAKYVLEKGTYEGFMAAASLLSRPMSSVRAKWHRDGTRLKETYMDQYLVKDTKSKKESLWKRILKRLLKRNC